MEVNVLDTLDSSMPITQKQFEQTYKTLKKQHDENPDQEEFKTEFTDKTKEYASSVRRVVLFRLGGTEIKLTKITAKPGYYLT